ncbi:multicopper oxidase domain-containing protein [Pseudactinotalea sp.]|uniref:multicopper oxidase domain-containing protein n=1 Tax=Pseudactinotalea sp. TaxID=1926260 RepID=UPI003B3A5450
MSVSRRSFLGWGGAAVATAVLAGCGSNWFSAGSGTGSHGALLASRIPLPDPFRVPLPIPPNLEPRDGTIEIAARRSAVEILPGRTTEILGYEGAFPGPTIRARSGEELQVRLQNDSEIDTVLHLHGGKTPAEHDGYPTDLLVPGAERTYVYPLEQRAAPLWYHDHAMDFTGPNVYAGLAGMAIVGSDDEDALGLPTGDRDLPLVIADRSFDDDGAFMYPLADPSRARPGVTMRYHGGVLGDCVLVNGAPWPVLEVDAARYRFRILNASNARRFQLSLDHGVAFTQVGTDLGLLERPVARTSIAMAGAERADVVIDFSGVPVGTRVTMTNTLEHGGPGQVMQFHVVRAAASDDTRVPEVLSTIEELDRAAVDVTRDLHFSLGATGSGHHGRADWTVNGLTFHDGDVFTSRLGTLERWRLSSDVHHPVHAHLLGFQVAAPGGDGLAWKDTIDLLPGSGAEVLVPIEGYTGRYVLHCHNLEHEDMMMMVNFSVVA